MSIWAPCSALHNNERRAHCRSRARRRPSLRAPVPASDLARVSLHYNVPPASVRGCRRITTPEPWVGALIALGIGGVCLAAGAGEQKTTARPHDLLVWAGDRTGKANDFLIVINADPGSADYGHMITTLATDQQTVRVHHTEYTMPASGMLFANDHDVGRTFIFDVRNPLQPKIATSFTDLAGYMHPHSYLRLPNGHVLATFQHTHHGAISADFGKTGGLVEINDAGEVVRAASNADAAFPQALLMPYGL